MEGVVAGGRFVIFSLLPDGCGASVSDLITRMGSCTLRRRPSSWETSVWKGSCEKMGKTVPRALVASPVGNPASGPRSTWAASGAWAMSSFGSFSSPDPSPLPTPATGKDRGVQGGPRTSRVNRGRLEEAWGLLPTCCLCPGRGIRAPLTALPHCE